MWLRTWAASYRSTPPPVASRSSPRSAPTRVSPPAATSACMSITNVSTSSIPTAAWPFSKKGMDDQQKAGGAPPAFCWSSFPFLENGQAAVGIEEVDTFVIDMQADVAAGG